MKNCPVSIELTSRKRLLHLFGYPEWSRELGIIRFTVYKFEKTHRDTIMVDRFRVTRRAEECIRGSPARSIDLERLSSNINRVWSRAFPEGIPDLWSLGSSILRSMNPLQAPPPRIDGGFRSRERRYDEGMYTLPSTTRSLPFERAKVYEVNEVILKLRVALNLLNRYFI